ncbi:hypothetical protein QZH41_001249 [Actinostola sp. cb2023]|nr:hypothetical protein QZH41_001249 [Actinostola sp. cb2023]
MNPHRPEDLKVGEEDGEEEEFRHHTAGFIGIRREFSALVHHEAPNLAVQKCEDDIMDLRGQLETKDKELTGLRKRVKDLEEKNNDLEFQLEKKCDEVKSLRGRIQKLEDEKRSLQEQLVLVKFNLDNITEEVALLSKSKEAQDEKNVELEGKLRKIQSTLEVVEGDLETTKEENKNLKVEVKEVRNQQRYVQGASLRLPLPAGEQNRAMSQLVELSCQIQDKMYSIVLPDDFTPVLRYTVKSIEKDIHRLPKTDAKQQEAIARWEKLKIGLEWNDDKTEVLQSLRESHNVVERPEEVLDEQRLWQCTKFLQKEGILKGWLSPDHVNGLIEIWKRLKQFKTE